MARPLRKDAAIRRRALLQAATEVFAEVGLDAPLEMIADRAGVGRATLYRNFADRADLALAVLTLSVEDLDQRTSDRGDGPDVFFQFLEDLAGLAATNAGFAAAVRARKPADALASLRDQVSRAGTPALRRAQDAGLVRADIEPEDIGLIASLFSAGTSLPGRGPADQARVAARSLSLILDGLRPNP